MPNPFWAALAQQMSVLGNAKLLLAALTLAAVVYLAGWFRTWTA